MTTTRQALVPDPQAPVLAPQLQDVRLVPLSTRVFVTSLMTSVTSGRSRKAEKKAVIRSIGGSCGGRPG